MRKQIPASAALWLALLAGCGGGSEPSPSAPPESTEVQSGTDAFMARIAQHCGQAGQFVEQ